MSIRISNITICENTKTVTTFTINLRKQGRLSLKIILSDTYHSSRGYTELLSGNLIIFYFCPLLFLKSKRFNWTKQILDM